MTTTNRLFRNISNIYMATEQSPTFWFCASNNYFPTAHPPIICLLQIDKIFHKWKSSKYLLVVHRNIELELQIAHLERFNDLYDYCAKPKFFATAHLLFCFCASPNYLSSANRPLISPLGIV